MTKLHNKLSESSPLYRAWHQTPYISVVHFFILAVLTTFFANAIISQTTVPAESLTANAINTAAGRVIMTPKTFGIASDHIIVKFKKGTVQSKRDSVITQRKLHKKWRIQNLDVDVLSVDPSLTPEEAVQNILNSNRGDIEFAEVDPLLQATAIPNDPNFSSEWNKTIVNAPAAWDITTGSSSVVVAIADTGVDCTHEDLAASCVPGWNFYDNNNDTRDVYGHGTAVAGVVAAIGNNGLGIAGTTWNAKIMPLRISDPSGYAYASTVANAITYAADRGVKVVNNSFGPWVSNYSIETAARYLWDRGGLFVRSEGNSGANSGGTYNDPYSLAVSGSDPSNALYSWSTYGTDVDVAAPGCASATTASGGGYRSFCGTSNSSPEVAGLLALMWSASPTASPQTIRDTLFSTALDLGTPGWDQYFGWGRIDAGRAIATLGGNPPPPQVNAPVVTISASPASGTVSVVNPALTWSTTNNPTSCVASGDWSGNQATSGNAVSQGVLNIVKTYTYTLTCSNTAGSDTKSTTVTVADAPVITPTPTPTPIPLGAYRYVKFNVTATKSEPTSGCTQISEFTLLSSNTPIAWPTGSVVANPGGANFSGEGPGNVIDGSLNNKLCDTNAVNSTPMTVVVDTGSGVTFDGYKYGTANDLPGRDPVTWTVEGSNDNSSWTVLDSRTNEVITDSLNTYTSNYNFSTANPPPAADTTAPSVPQNLSASASSSTQINISWNASTDDVGVAGYNLYRDGVKIWNGLGLSYTDTAVQAQTTYAYYVSAYDAAGNVSAQSGTVNATTPSLPVVGDTTPPSVPLNVSAVPYSSTQINLSWSISTDNVGVTGYTIYRSGTKIATTTSTGYINTGLTGNKTYSYTISAYDAAGNASLQSASVSVTTLATPLTITSFRIYSKTTTSASIKWSTNVTSTGNIIFGTSSASLSRSAANTTSGTSHTTVLSGLTRNTKYYYQINAIAGTATASSSISSFQTSSR